MKERVQLYRWLKRIAQAPLRLDELRGLDQEVLIRGLAKRELDGSVSVTEKGRQFIFYCDCEAALDQTGRHCGMPEDPAIQRWLLSERFVLEPSRGCDQWQITPRGREWLLAAGARHGG